MVLVTDLWSKLLWNATNGKVSRDIFTGHNLKSMETMS